MFLWIPVYDLILLEMVEKKISIITIILISMDVNQKVLSDLESTSSQSLLCATRSASLIKFCLSCLILTIPVYEVQTFCFVVEEAKAQRSCETYSRSRGSSCGRAETGIQACS